MRSLPCFFFFFFAYVRIPRVQLISWFKNIWVICALLYYNYVLHGFGLLFFLSLKWLSIVIASAQIFKKIADELGYCQVSNLLPWGPEPTLNEQRTVVCGSWRTLVFFFFLFFFGDLPLLSDFDSGSYRGNIYERMVILDLLGIKWIFKRCHFLDYVRIYIYLLGPKQRGTNESQATRAAQHS